MTNLPLRSDVEFVKMTSMKPRPHSRTVEVARAPARRDGARSLLLGEAVAAFGEVARALETAEVEDLARQLGEDGSSPVETVLRVLEHPAALGTVRGDPLARARMRGIRAREELLGTEGGPVSAAELAEVVRVSRQTVDAWRKAGRVLALERGRRGFFYPGWQAHQGRLLPGLTEVLRTLEPSDFWGKLSFILSPDPRLGDERPLDLLRRGEAARVRELAAVHGEHGAL